jgi:hypothetical protein
MQTNMWMQATNSMSMHITKIILPSPLEINISNDVTVGSTHHSVIAVSGARVVLAACYEKYACSFSQMTLQSDADRHLLN